MAAFHSCFFKSIFGWMDGRTTVVILFTSDRARFGLGADPFVGAVLHHYETGGGSWNCCAAVEACLQTEGM